MESPIRTYEQRGAEHNNNKAQSYTANGTRKHHTAQPRKHGHARVAEERNTQTTPTYIPRCQLDASHTPEHTRTSGVTGPSIVGNAATTHAHTDAKHQIQPQPTFKQPTLSTCPNAQTGVQRIKKCETAQVQLFSYGDSKTSPCEPSVGRLAKTSSSNLVSVTQILPDRSFGIWASACDSGGPLDCLHWLSFPSRSSNPAPCTIAHNPATMTPKSLQSEKPFTMPCLAASLVVQVTHRLSERRQ